jgi:biotin carboxylase
MSPVRKSILILGGGVMQIPALRIARERGWRIILADGNPEPAGAMLADQFINVDLKDRDGLARAALELKRKGRLDGVFTAGTDFSASVAWVAEQAGLPGLAFETAMRATDKSLMRAAFAQAGVPSPRYVAVETSSLGSRAVDELPLPVVVKPVDNMGARGTRRIDDRAELKTAIEEALSLSRSGKAIVEEYVEGPEFSIDAIVEAGRIALCGIADRDIRFPPFFIEMGHTMPTDSAGETVAALRSAFEAGVRAIGIDNGAAKGDVKMSARGPVIGEIAARLSGGYMSGWTYPYASGVLPTAAALNLAVGLPAGELAPRWNLVSAERAFISIPGRVERVHGFEASCILPYVRDGFLRARPGDVVSFPRNNVEKCGNFISQAPERELASRAAEEACRGVLVLLEPGNRETASFLFKGGDPWIPGAFAVDDALRARIDSLAPFRPGAGRQLLSIEPLSAIPATSCTDWQGRTITEALALVESVTGVRVDGSGSHRIGSLFWRAFLRGGAQGGVWVIESLRHGLEEGRSIEAISREWGA